MADGLALSFILRRRQRSSARPLEVAQQRAVGIGVGGMDGKQNQTTIEVNEQVCSVGRSAQCGYLPAKSDELLAQGTASRQPRQRGVSLLPVLSAPEVLLIS